MQPLSAGHSDRYMWLNELLLVDGTHAIPLAAKNMTTMKNSNYA